MLQVRNLAKGYQGRLLFSDVSFTLTPRERLGLVGRNGSGKSTLFRLILGEESPDDGEIERPRNYTIGHLSQLICFTRTTVLEEACLALAEREEGWIEEHRAEKILMGLGFSLEDLARAPGELSGGFQVRLQLAKVLIAEPRLLLLDEPTNYLDILSVRWLERFLVGWPGEMMLITHDQTFMDKVTTHTMSIHRQRMRRIEGPTTKLYELLAVEEEIYEKTRRNEEKARKQAEVFINRFRAKASKASVVQSRIKMLDKREQLSELESIAGLEFRFHAAGFQGNHMIEARQLGFRFPGQSEPLIEDFSIAIRKGERVGVVGKNGKGKSTLLNLLAGELRPLQGEVLLHPNLELAHFGQNGIDRLDPEKSVEEEILEVHPDNDRRAARGICGAMLFGDDDALKKVRHLSGGERARVLLGRLLVSPANSLLLDEPTNHLDMDAIDSLIDAIRIFPGSVLIVTHNERVLEAVATRLVVFDRGTVRIFEGPYVDFLERWGWSDEGPAPAADAPPSAAASRKERRRRRAEAVALRARTLKPLAARMARLEQEIIEQEARRTGVEEALCRASEQADVDGIARLSRDLRELSAGIERRYAQFEEISAEHDRKAHELGDPQEE